MEYTTKIMEPPGKGGVSRHKKKHAESIKEKTGATAEQIRKAVEAVGFDRAKVEEYIKNLLNHS